MSNIPKRKEIWLVRFNPTIGDEIQKTRPAIVISSDNLPGLALRLVVPITGWKPAFDQIPWLIKLQPTLQNGLTKSSVANPLQTRSVALARLPSKLGTIADEQMDSILMALQLITQ
ncbi:MAG: type II toxin-antitoxin system PemK/MazF family toxin [Alkalinema sp. RU_4_3]|nr:type II toxin-antitoxin system PemK/MazF family toxin [Alkalinema sp. RU_4_3]